MLRLISARRRTSVEQLARLALLLLVLSLVAGCRTGQLPDPNNPGIANGVMQAAILRRNLDYANKLLEHRAEVGEISLEKRKVLLQRYAEELIDKIDVNKIPEDQAWEYADIFKTAEQWDKAKHAYELAIKHPKTEDRRINDTLRLALCEAHLGDVERAIEQARSTFNAKETDTAPILPAVLLEIEPAAEGKGHDGELASLLVDAIAQHQRTIVDPKTESGKMYFMAKPIHIRDAYRKAIQLYSRAGMTAEAKQTSELAHEALSQFGHM